MPRVVPSQVVQVIDQFFPVAQAEVLGATMSPVKLNTSTVGQFNAIVDLVKQIPDNLILIPGDEYGLLIGALGTIRAAIGEWNATPNKLLQDVTLPKVVGQNPIALIRRVLEKCADEAAGPAAAGLEFIGDADFRAALRIDIGSVEVALSNGEWKGATVLAGSIIEALLLWALEKRKADAIAAKNAPKDPKKKPELALWDLHNFIEVARELEVITEETAQQARLGKSFRNLIHPGRSVRLGQVCDRGTALSAVAAVEHVIRDLSQAQVRSVAK